MSVAGARERSAHPTKEWQGERSRLPLCSSIISFIAWMPRSILLRQQGVRQYKTSLKKITPLMQPFFMLLLLVAQPLRTSKHPRNRSFCIYDLYPSIWCRLKLSPIWKRSCVKWCCASAALCKQLSRSDSHIHRASTHSAASGLADVSVVCWVLLWI